jgi:hypothetical protein
VLTLLLGMLGTMGLCVAMWKYADVPPGWAALLHLAPVFVAQLLATALVLGVLAWLVQGRTLTAHVTNGAKWDSFRGVIVACLLSGGLLFAVQAAVTYPATWDGSGGGLEIAPNQELYYREGVTREQALRLGQKLREVGVFDELGRGKTLVLSKEDNRFRLRVFVREDTWKDPDALEYFRGLRDLLAREVFPDSSLEIVLCDQYNRVKRVIKAAE